MDTILEIEEHPLPPDTWGEAPATPLDQANENPPTSSSPTLPPNIEP